VSIVLGLATGGMPGKSIQFGYRWDACELYLDLVIGPIPVSSWPLVTVG
jgi:hypothetical protein